MTESVFLKFMIIVTLMHTTLAYCDRIGCTKENADRYCKDQNCVSTPSNVCYNLYVKNGHICPCDVVCEPSNCTDEYRKKVCPIDKPPSCTDSYLEGNNLCTCSSKENCTKFECDPELRKTECKARCGHEGSCREFYAEGNFVCSCLDDN